MRRLQRGFWQIAIPAAATALSAWLSSKGQKDANESNVQLGREQMAFQEKMSSTAYQRATADMQAAGLNPMLAYSQGGATSPPGAMPQVQNRYAAGIGSAGQAAAAQQAMQAIEMSKSQQDLIAAQAAQVRSETIDNQINTALRLADVDLRRAQALDKAEGVLGTSSESYEKFHRSGATSLGRNRLTDELLLLKQHEPPKAGSAFASDVARRKAEAQGAMYGLAEQKSMSDFWDSKVGAANPYLRQIFQLLRALSSARGFMSSK